MSYAFHSRIVDCSECEASDLRRVRGDEYRSRRRRMAEKAAQKAAHFRRKVRRSIRPRGFGQDRSKARKRLEFQELREPMRASTKRLQTRGMGRAGLEHPADSAGNTRVSDSSGSKSGNIGADATPPSTPPVAPAITTPPASSSAASGGTIPPTPATMPHNASGTNPDTDLSAIVAAWPTLPTAIKAGILALVGAARA